MWVPLEKSQSIRRVQGPLQRPLGLATVHGSTARPQAGGKSTDKGGAAALTALAVTLVDDPVASDAAADQESEGATPRTVITTPLRARLAAIRDPMIPSPRNATRSLMASDDVNRGRLARCWCN